MIQSNKLISLKIKEVSKHGLVYGVGTIFESLLQIILIPLYANSFLPSEYGAFALIQVSASMAAAFFYLGGSTALNRFYYEASDEGEQKVWFSNILLLTVLGSSLMYFLVYLGSKQIVLGLFGSESYLHTLYVLFLSTALSLVNTLFYLLARLRKMSTWFVFLKIVSLISSWSAIMLFIRLSDNIMNATAFGFLFGQGLVLALMIIKFSSYIVLEPNRFLLLKFLRFGFPMALSGLIYIGIDWSVRYFINVELGQESLGQYSMGFKIGSLIQAGYIIPFSLIWGTIRMEYMNDDNTSKFFSKVLSYFIVLGLLIILIVSLNVVDILQLMSSGNSYLESSRIVPIILMSQLVLGTINIVDFGIFTSNKTLYYPYYYGVILSAVVLMGSFFIPKAGLIGGGFSNLLGSVFLVFLVYRKANAWFRIEVNYKLILTLVLMSTLLIYGGNIIDSQLQDCILRILVKNMTGIGLFLIITFFLLSSHERKLIRRLLCNLKSVIRREGR